MERLERMGYQRQEPDQGEKKIRLLYFSWLVRKMRREAEQVVVAANVPDVDSLLPGLGRRKQGAAVLFENGRVWITANKQFVVPSSPTAPATPDLI